MVTKGQGAVASPFKASLFPTRPLGVPRRSLGDIPEEARFSPQSFVRKLFPT